MKVKVSDMTAKNGNPHGTNTDFVLYIPSIQVKQPKIYHTFKIDI